MITDTESTAQSSLTADQPGRESGRRETAADRRARPCFHDVAVSAAEKHGVCVRPLVMRTLDLDSGISDYVGVPCKIHDAIPMPVMRDEGTPAADAATPR